MATWSLEHDILMVFARVWHVGLLHKLKSYGISGQIFDIILSFPSNRQLRIFLGGKSIKQYPVNAGVSQGSILDLTFFLLYMNDFPDEFISNITIYVDDTTLFKQLSYIIHLLSPRLVVAAQTYMKWKRIKKHPQDSGCKHFDNSGSHISVTL